MKKKYFICLNFIIFILLQTINILLWKEEKKYQASNKINIRKWKKISEKTDVLSKFISKFISKKTMSK